MLFLLKFELTKSVFKKILYYVHNKIKPKFVEVSPEIS